jgi:ABC-2 type transport system permease protein
MAGLGGAGAGGSGPSEPAGAGAAHPFGPLARSQYSALAAMRWQMFKNNLRSNMGMLELGARTLSFLIYGTMGLGLSVGLGFGSYAMVHYGKIGYLPILFWVVFLIWQLLPIMLASLQEQFDLGILLRFPLGFASYFLLYIVFGLVDISTITGALCCFGLWAGLTVARPDLSFLIAASLLVFAVFNILLVRAVFAWIDRWLAQRRTREIVGAIFLFFVLSLQLLNPALRQTRRSNALSREDRIAEQRQTANSLRPWLEKANAVQRWLPPGLAAQAVRMGGADQLEMAIDSMALIAMYALAAGTLLAIRLNKEFAGESLGEAPGRAKAVRKRVVPSGAASVATHQGAEWLPESAGPIVAIVRKEFTALLRTLPMIYAIGAPLLLVLVFSGAFIGHGPVGHTFELALPVCMIYSQLGFTQLLYNNLGAEGTGIQLYFLSPTPFHTVLLAKNLFHAILFALVATTAGVLASLRTGPPALVVVAATVCWLLFSLPCNLAAGNIFSLTMAYRVNPGRLTKQRGSQASNLLSLLIQVGVIAVGATVFWMCWLFDEKWLAAPIFLGLAVIAFLVWRTVLGNVDAVANRNKDKLIATLAKTA